MSFDAAVRRAQQSGGLVTSYSDVPFSEYADRWLREGKAVWAPKTEAQRRQVLSRWVKPFIGHVPLRMLNRSRIREFRSELVNAGCPAKSANAVMRVVSACLSVAAEDELIPANPALGMRSIPVPPPKRRAHADAVVAAIMESMPTDRDRLVVGLLVSGLRPAEVVGLQWTDVGSDSLAVRRTIQKGIERPTKTRSSRTVPLSPEARQWLPVEREGTFVVAGATGVPLNWQMWVRRVWRPAARKAGTDAVPYEMRHVAAHRLLEQGTDIVSAARIMGHSVRVMSDVYVHPTDRAL